MSQSSNSQPNFTRSKGANAVESDVTFGRDGDPLYTYHGPPCDCWRHCYQQEEFREYLSYVREIAIDTPDGIGQNLSLLFLDLKLDALDQRAKINAGRELAKAVVEHLFLDSEASKKTITNNATDYFGTSRESQSASQVINQLPRANLPPLHLILSVNHVQDIDLIRNFIHYLEINNSSHLMQRIGFDVGMNDDLQLIETMWRRFGPSLNIWQGDGYTNCFSPFYNLERLTRALSKRDQPSGFPAKVYHWTIDLHDRMRESLRLGVDAIMTNHPERVLNVLQEPEMAHNYRLATRQDDPFRKLTRDSVGRSSGETARYQRSASSTSGGFVANLVDVLASWINYMREIPFLSFPATIVSPSSRSYKQKMRQASQQANSVMLVKLENQSPEYNIDPQSSPLSRVDGQKQRASGEQQNTGDNKTQPSPPLYLDNDQQSPSYEGPKWYTTLASNMLVSLMKIFLPT